MPILGRAGSELRANLRSSAGVDNRRRDASQEPTTDLLAELDYVVAHRAELERLFNSLDSQSILFAGQAYYNAWYLSRELRLLGWEADVLDWDSNPNSAIHYHGADYALDPANDALEIHLEFYLRSLYCYRVFHFSNAHGIQFGAPLWSLFGERYGPNSEVWLLKSLGKKITYANNGCLDGVSQTSFAAWGASPVCGECRWQEEPTVCNDSKNLEFGALRNAVADRIVLLGGNRVDWNRDAHVHEDPYFYCLDPQVWHPALCVPPEHRIAKSSADEVLIYQGVGNRSARTRLDGRDIKSSYIWEPILESLMAEGTPIQDVRVTGQPNLDVRYLQLQCDVHVDMLTYGWFGAGVREALMLGKPVICFIRPEWLEQVGKELPDYAAELPIISATPDTARNVLLDLINDPAARAAVGAKGRQFAMKWHASDVAAAHWSRMLEALVANEVIAGSPYPRLTAVTIKGRHVPIMTSPL